MWMHQFIRLCVRSALSAPALLSSNWLAAVVSVATFGAPQLAKWKKHGWGWAYMKQNYRENLKVGIYTLAAVWVLIFIASAGRNVYGEHSYFVGQTRGLAQKNAQLIAKNQNLSGEVAKLQKQLSIRSRKTPALSVGPPIEISSGQMGVLVDNLLPYKGNTVRLLEVGAGGSQPGLLFSQLDEIFKRAQWKRQRLRSGRIAVAGLNFPSGTYLTGSDMSSKLLTAVFSIFHSAGVDIPLVPDAEMGPLATGPAPKVVIVIH